METSPTAQYRRGGFDTGEASRGWLKGRQVRGCREASAHRGHTAQARGHHQDENPRAKPSVTQGSFRQVAKTQGTPVRAVPRLAAQLGV